MIISWLTLILSTAMVFFYLQATCQKILRRRFDREYFRSIANVVRLEFVPLQKSLADPGSAIEYSRLTRALNCDFLALTHLLKNAEDRWGYSREQRLLILYFRVQLLSFAMRRLLRVGERSAALRLTSVLKYFANVVGERLNTPEFVKSTAAD